MRYKQKYHGATPNSKRFASPTAESWGDCRASNRYLDIETYWRRNMAVKKVKGIFESGSPHWLGDGFNVRNLFPSNGLEDEISPFLMLDYAGPTIFPPASQPRGVDKHPHRGFETVTIVYQGSLEHRDSGGNAGTIGPGDVQWMTAGSGVVHEEKQTPQFAKEGGAMEMVQLWVNLPKSRKMRPPRYQTLLADQ